MLNNYTAKYTRISSGYMGQLVEWPEVITEGSTLEECRDMLKDVLYEMVKAYKQQGRSLSLKFLREGRLPKNFRQGYRYGRKSKGDSSKS